MTQLLPTEQRVKFDSYNDVLEYSGIASIAIGLIKNCNTHLVIGITESITENTSGFNDEALSSTGFGKPDFIWIVLNSLMKRANRIPYGPLACYCYTH